MGSSTENSEGSLEKGKRRGFFGLLVKTVFHYLTAVPVAVLLMLGGFEVYDFWFPEVIPKIGTVNADFRGKRWVATPYKEFNDEECWEALQPSVEILDEVWPEAAAWVRDRHKNGKIEYIPTEGGSPATCAACYRPITMTLGFHQESFHYPDGIRATLLAHEFVHSRQNYTRFYKERFAFLLTCGADRLYIVEKDAEEYEAKIRNLIYD
jgi:hypothetical protein